MKALDFLKLGSYAVLDHFLQHITELVQVKVTKDTTLLDVLQSLKEQCPREDALKAIDAWAELQDQDVLPKRIHEIFEDIEEDEVLYMAFNIWNKKETD